MAFGLDDVMELGDRGAACFKEAAESWPSDVDVSVGAPGSDVVASAGLLLRRCTPRRIAN